MTLPRMTTRFGILQIAICVLAFATAVVHIYLGVIGPRRRRRGRRVCGFSAAHVLGPVTALIANTGIRSPDAAVDEVGRAWGDRAYVVGGEPNGFARRLRRLRHVAGGGIGVNPVRSGIIDTAIHADSGRPDRVADVEHTLPMGRAGRPKGGGCCGVVAARRRVELLHGQRPRCHGRHLTTRAVSSPRRVRIRHWRATGRRPDRRRSRTYTALRPSSP
jgi:hypothetical protein